MFRAWWPGLFNAIMRHNECKKILIRTAGGCLNIKQPIQEWLEHLFLQDIWHNNRSIMRPNRTMSLFQNNWQLSSEIAWLLRISILRTVVVGWVIFQIINIQWRREEVRVMSSATHGKVWASYLRSSVRDLNRFNLRVLRNTELLSNYEVAAF